MRDLNCWNQWSQQEPEVQELLCKLFTKLVWWALAREKVAFCTVKLNMISEQIISDVDPLPWLPWNRCIFSLWHRRGTLNTFLTGKPFHITLDNTGCWNGFSSAGPQRALTVGTRKACYPWQHLKYLVFWNAVQVLLTVKAVSGLLFSNFSLPSNGLLDF